jgi:hypothetical protein
MFAHVQCQLLCYLFALGFSIHLGHTISAQEASSPADVSDKAALVKEAFQKCHAGWSVDEVLLHNERRKAFLDACEASGSHLPEKELWEQLLRSRKGGKLNVQTTKEERISLEDYAIPAEIAARRLSDEHQVHFDQVLCDPELLEKFDQQARELSPGTDVYLLRKAALRLRKSRMLKPELTLHATDWQVDIVDYSLAEITEKLSTLSTRPGIYIFRDQSGYLYIGQSHNLRERLTHHLQESDRDQLRRYLIEESGSSLTVELHIFRDGSPGEQLRQRRAYESELIRSRQPRLNLSAK